MLSVGHDEHEMKVCCVSVAGARVRPRSVSVGDKLGHVPAGEW